MPVQFAQAYEVQCRSDDGSGSDEKRTDLFAIRRHGGMKGIVSSDGNTEVYDLVTDPGETNDLSEAAPSLTEEFRRQVRQWIEEKNRDAGREERLLDVEQIERLRELGYLR